MNHHLLLLFIFLVALAIAGASPLEDNKICRPHSRPWQVHLRGSSTSCSAALISKWWLVTSFECAPNSYNAVATLGVTDVNAEEGTEQHIQVAEVIRHSPYRSPLHSLAMVRLAEPARFNQFVQPVPLPASCPQPGEICQVSGWGSTTPNHYESPSQLKCITVPIVDDQTCMNTLPEYLYWSHGMVCAGSANMDNCLNDGGSVLVCNGHLQGVQWFSNGCDDPSHPSVYTKICLYMDWITRVLNSYTPTTTTTMATTTSRPRGSRN